MAILFNVYSNLIHISVNFAVLTGLKSTSIIWYLKNIFIIQVGKHFQAIKHALSCVLMALWCVAGLPILHRTQVLLYPLVPVLLVFLMSLAAGWNVTHTVMDFYHYRVV